MHLRISARQVREFILGLLGFGLLALLYWLTKDTLVTQLIMLIAIAVFLGMLLFIVVSAIFIVMTFLFEKWRHFREGKTSLSD